MAVVQHPITKKFVNADVLAKELAAGSDAGRKAQIEQFRETYDVADPGQAKPPTGGTSGAPAADLGREQPPAPKFSKHLLRRAKALDMDESDFADWDPERLEDVIYGREHERNEATRQRLSQLEGMWTSPQSLQRDPSVPDPRQVSPGTAPASPAEEPDAFVDELKRGFPDLAPDVAQEPAPSVIGKMHEAVRGAAGRRWRRTGRRGRGRRSPAPPASMSFAEQADAFFAEAPGDLRPQVGQDRSDRKSDEFALPAAFAWLLAEIKSTSPTSAARWEKLHQHGVRPPGPERTTEQPAASAEGASASGSAARRPRAQRRRRAHPGGAPGASGTSTPNCPRRPRGTSRKCRAGTAAIAANRRRSWPAIKARDGDEQATPARGGRHSGLTPGPRHGEYELWPCKQPT
jgi:hypothetical protein